MTASGAGGADKCLQSTTTHSAGFPLGRIRIRWSIKGQAPLLLPRPFDPPCALARCQSERTARKRVNICREACQDDLHIRICFSHRLFASERMATALQMAAFAFSDALPCTVCESGSVALLPVARKQSRHSAGFPRHCPLAGWLRSLPFLIGDGCNVPMPVTGKESRSNVGKLRGPSSSGSRLDALICGSLDYAD